MARASEPERIRLNACAVWAQMERHGIVSQNELARRLGKSSGYMAQLINGTRCPSAELRRLILATLPGATFDELFVVDGVVSTLGVSSMEAVGSRESGGGQ